MHTCARIWPTGGLTQKHTQTRGVAIRVQHRHAHLLCAAFDGEACNARIYNSECRCPRRMHDPQLQARTLTQRHKHPFVTRTTKSHQLIIVDGRPARTYASSHRWHSQNVDGVRKLCTAHADTRTHARDMIITALPHLNTGPSAMLKPRLSADNIFRKYSTKYWKNYETESIKALEFGNGHAHYCAYFY